MKFCHESFDCCYCNSFMKQLKLVFQPNKPYLTNLLPQPCALVLPGPSRAQLYQGPTLPDFFLRIYQIILNLCIRLTKLKQSSKFISLVGIFNEQYYSNQLFCSYKNAHRHCEIKHFQVPLVFSTPHRYLIINFSNFIIKIFL